MEIFPNWTLIPIILIILTLVFTLNRLLFRPLGKVLEERHQKIEGARLEAEQIRISSQEKAQEFDRKLRDARREADQQIAEVKTAAVGEKNEVVAHQREETQRMLAESKADLRAKTEEAQRKLQSEAQQFANQIAAQILKRPIQRGSSQA
jgi:F-type H+-transporting ATPase subunit b